MDETVIFPSPVWFQSSGIAVSSDGWLIYGVPSKSLCIIRPVGDSGNEKPYYQAQFLRKAHNEKIVSVDISPEWPEKRLFVTGSTDGIVKQWSLTEVNNGVKIKYEQSHDVHNKEKEEVVGVGYSNETYVVTVGSFGNIVKWNMSSNIVKSFTKFLKNFKPTCLACSPHLPLNVSVGTKQGVIFVLDLNDTGKILYKVRGQNDEIVHVSWCPQYEVLVKKSLDESERKSYLSDRLAKIRLESENVDSLNKSGVSKDLPEDSFDEPAVEEDDMFDIYKDHEDDEFGHSKYKPEMIVVKVKKEEQVESDYLTECMKLKEDLLKLKNAPEESIENLVDAMDRAHVNPSPSDADLQSEEKQDKVEESSSHPHKHLLASIGKFGGVRIWSKTGKLVSSCAVMNNSNQNHNQKNKSPAWATLLWYKPDVLLIADGKSRLLTCNPLKVDSKNKIEWKLEHSLHKRGLFCIASNAPKLQVDKKNKTEKVDIANTQPENSIKSNVNVTTNKWVVWSASQDRNLICYSLEKHEPVAVYNSCGGHIYMIESCPYDARQVAISVGDGAVRIWETDLSEDETRLLSGTVHTYWQNVQGKVLSIAWHPNKENLLAFGTAESRVGLIDTGGKGEKAARTLMPSLRGGIYSMCWGADDCLYTCGGDKLVVYNTNKVNEDPTPIVVQIEGREWGLSSVRWHEKGVLVGSNHGGVALLTPTHEPITAIFIFSKMIHHMDWHPQQVSKSNEESPYKNLIAVSSLDKQSNIVILEYNDQDSPKFTVWKTLSGHKDPVLQVVWNPHIEELLLSSSQDCTIRVWDVLAGACTHIFGGHAGGRLAAGAAWSAYPALAHTALTGGADCALRVWDARRHPADCYAEITHELTKDKKKKVVQKLQEKSDDSGNVAVTSDCTVKPQKKFLLPTITGQMYPLTALKIRKLAERYLINSNVVVNGNSEVEKGMDFIKMFGNTNDVNAVLDLELENHIENDRLESWMMLSIYRGEMAATMQFASERDLLCPFLLSLAPCVSFKFWKDTMQLYLAQVDRMIAKGEGDKQHGRGEWGGAVHRRAALQLAAHAAPAAARLLAAARLHHAAYVLARARHMDSIAEEILKSWASDSLKTGMYPQAAVCYIALKDPYQAAVALSKINDQDYLNLAADLAKMSGQVTFAQHIDEKIEKTQNENETEALKPLPSRVELLTDIANTES